MDCGLRTADCGLGLKHGLRYKTRTTDLVYKNTDLGIKCRLSIKVALKVSGI